MGLKTCDSDLQGQIGLQTCKICFKLLNLAHLKVSEEFETNDLDLQDQICHKSSNVSLVPCEFANFWTFLNFTFQMKQTVLIN